MSAPRRDPAFEVWRVSQVLALGWYDGPTDGICRFHGQREYWFSLLDQRLDPAGLDDRLFTLSVVPPSSMDRALAALDFLGPASPLWVPRWTPDGEPRWVRAVELLDEIEASRAEPTIILQSTAFDPITAGWHVGALPEGVDWLERLGLSAPL